MQPALRPVIMALAALLAQFTAGCGRSSDPASVLSEFSPDRWPQHDRDRYLAFQSLSDSDAPKRLQQAAVSSKGMVAGTSDPFAVHAGLEILKHGGSAADAALTTALTQVALTAGSTISYAGTMTVVRCVNRSDVHAQCCLSDRATRNGSGHDSWNRLA
jgi:hypothetical protein